MTNPINSMEQLRLKMGKTVNCFFLNAKEGLSNDNCEKEKNSVFRTSISNSIFFARTHRKICHLFHDKLGDRKSQDFVKAISTNTFLVLDWIMNKFISGSTVKIF